MGPNIMSYYDLESRMKRVKSKTSSTGKLMSDPCYDQKEMIQVVEK